MCGPSRAGIANIILFFAIEVGCSNHFSETRCDENALWQQFPTLLQCLTQNIVPSATFSPIHAMVSKASSRNGQNNGAFHSQTRAGHQLRSEIGVRKNNQVHIFWWLQLHCHIFFLIRIIVPLQSSLCTMTELIIDCSI